MRLRQWFTALVVSFALPAASHASDIPVAPSSKWLMQYDRDSCTLSRSFGVGDNETSIRFTRYKPDADFELRLVGKKWVTDLLHPMVGILFGSEGKSVSSRAMAGLSDNLPTLFLSGRLDNLDYGKIDIDKMAPAERTALETIAPATESVVTTMTIRFNGRSKAFLLGSMGRPMAELRKCTADLVRTWGLNSDEQEKLTKRATPKTALARWLGSNDYPSGSLLRGEQAIIHFRLLVDPAGLPTACAVQSAIGTGSFAEVSCNLLRQRARFEPAVAANGKLVSSYYVGTIIWILPDRI